MSVGELLNAEETGWVALRARLDQLDDRWTEPGVNGDWSAKDVLAHIAAWHSYTAELLEQFNAGNDIRKPWTDEMVNAFNAEAYARHRSMPLDEIRGLSDGARAEFLGEVAMLDDDGAAKVQRLVRANAEGHYEEHIEQLDKFLGAK